MQKSFIEYIRIKTFGGGAGSYWVVFPFFFCFLTADVLQVVSAPRATLMEALIPQASFKNRNKASQSA